LRYIECRTQWQRKVLESDDYYNGWIEEFKGPATRGSPLVRPMTLDVDITLRINDD